MALVGPVPGLPEVKCIFSNRSHRKVDIIWTNGMNKFFRYAQLDKNQSCGITTFEGLEVNSNAENILGHQWIFRDAQNGNPLIIHPDRTRMFIARPMASDETKEVRIGLSISEISLKKLALQNISKILSAHFTSSYRFFNELNSSPESWSSIERIGLPTSLQVDLARFFLSCTKYQASIEVLDRDKQQFSRWLSDFIESRTIPDFNSLAINNH